LLTYWNTFADLIAVSFRHAPLIWGIVPLYFALLLNEITSSKASFRTAVQTGFSFVWAAVQWLYPYFQSHSVTQRPTIHLNATLPVNLFVTFLVLGIGIVALISGIRRKYPKYCAFLGYTRFSNYFMIAIYPMQAHYLAWTWERVAAVAIFALPIWVLLHFGLMPLRNQK
jgi:hypothetical protein